MKKYFLPFIYALPSVLIGTLVMYMQGISVTIYIRNFIFLIIGSILSIIYMLRKSNIKLKHICAIAVLSVLFLYSSFLSDGIDGVHRWIPIGPIYLNAAFIALPILLITISRLLLNGYAKFCYTLIFITAIALFLQPDASMLSAFSIALIPFFCTGNTDRPLRYVILFLHSCSTCEFWAQDANQRRHKFACEKSSIYGFFTLLLFLSSFAFSCGFSSFPGKYVHRHCPCSFPLHILPFQVPAPLRKYA